MTANEARNKVVHLIHFKGSTATIVKNWIENYLGISLRTIWELFGNYWGTTSQVPGHPWTNLYVETSSAKEYYQPRQQLALTPHNRRSQRKVRQVQTATKQLQTRRHSPEWRTQCRTQQVARHQNRKRSHFAVPKRLVFGQLVWGNRCHPKTHNGRRIQLHRQSSDLLRCERQAKQSELTWIK